MAQRAPGPFSDLGQAALAVRSRSEGIHTCELALELAGRYDVHMRITREIARVVRGESTAMEAHRGLVRQPPGCETD